jgi:hypothetical protein
MKYMGSNLIFNYSFWLVSWQCKNILMWTTNQVVETFTSFKLVELDIV